MEVVDLQASCDHEFIAMVEAESGQKIAECYQCGNCTAGCPYTFVYDLPVSQVMRLLQAGQKERVLSCKSIWLCATCESCTTRCPNNIDVARIMDVLRHIARREGFVAERNVKVFWDAFLDSVEKYGRSFEMGILATYIAKTGRFWPDMGLGPKILPKGKLSFKPHPIQGREQVAAICRRFREAQRS
jgi:heterodisulfide reductase subunit C2